MKFLSLVLALVAATSVSAFAPQANNAAVATALKANSARINTDGTEPAMYIDDERRFLMNLVMVGAGGLTVLGFGVPYIAFFFPPGAGGGGGGIPAKDALGNDLMAKAYLDSKPAKDRSLAQGLKGDATYLIVKEDKTLESYGLNAVCTHLGCVVPWSAANNKFMCPCHGSQYAPTGAVVRGPAPLPLALAHCDIGEDGKIYFSQWTEEDFRTGGKGWWN